MYMVCYKFEVLNCCISWLKNSKLDDEKHFYNLLMTMKRFAKLLDGLEELAYNKINYRS